MEELRERLDDAANERNRITFLLTDQTERKSGFARWISCNWDCRVKSIICWILRHR